MWYRCFIEPYHSNKIEKRKGQHIYFFTAKTYLKPKAALAENGHRKTVPGRNQKSYHEKASANVIIASKLINSCYSNQFSETTITTLIDLNYLSKLYDQCALSLKLTLALNS